MVHEDFDLESLAEYLHLTPAQVSRMVDRGQLPARRVGGQWRFSQAELHHWLEERIGAADEAGLIHVEGALQRADGEFGAATVLIADLLPLEAIAAPLEARTRSSIISAMVALAARTGLLWDPEAMTEAVRARENLHPTALDNGVALLHPRRPMPSILAEPLLALGRLHKGLPFGGPRGEPTDVFVLVGSGDDRGHLRTLARLSRLLGVAGFLEGLRELSEPTAIRAFIASMESQIPA